MSAKLHRRLEDIAMDYMKSQEEFNHWMSEAKYEEDNGQSASSEIAKKIDEAGNRGLELMGEWDMARGAAFHKELKEREMYERLNSVSPGWRSPYDRIHE